MYRPRHFDVDDPELLYAHVRAESFALVITASGGPPVASHIPLFLDQDNGAPGRLLGHVAKANPQWQAFDGTLEALALFWGPHAYVSPSWYEAEKAVPTWNYVTVHAYGRPRVLDAPEDTRDVLNRLVATYESDATGNWSMAGLPDDYVEKQIKGIVAFEIPIERLEGKAKLSQNRPVGDRKRVVDALGRSGNADAAAVARLMSERVLDD